MTDALATRLNPYMPAMLSVFRVVFGALFACHGLSHLFGWPKGPAAELWAWPIFYAGCFELVTAALITIGLFTRIAAFVAAGVMAFAYFTEHFPGGFLPISNGGELAVLYCFAFLLLIFSGGGTYALDSLRRQPVQPGAAQTSL